MELSYREAARRIAEHAEIHFHQEYPHAPLITLALKMAVDALNEKADLEEMDSRIKDGDPIWYVDAELQEIEEGKVVHVVFKNNKVDSISVDFLESGDFDEFYGTAMNECLFTSEEAARLALCNYMK